VGNLTRFQVRFARQTWPDEVLSSKIVVTGKRAEDGRNLVDLAVTLSNAEGEDKLVGEATAALP
jgi:acyl dehydratase